MSLPALLDLIATGDEPAFRKVVDLFSGRLYHFALGIVRNEQDAEEAVSDVFIKLWKLRNKLPAAGQFTFYLYKAVKHTSLNYVKKQKRRKDSEHLFYLEASVATESGAEDLLISKENIINIQHAINILPPRCREIFLLVKEDNLSYKQVAELLNISAATVNVQLTIAIKKVWGALDPALHTYHS